MKKKAYLSPVRALLDDTICFNQLKKKQLDKNYSLIDISQKKSSHQATNK